MKPKKSFPEMKGKNGILLFVEFLKGLLEDRKWRLKICRITNERERNVIQ